LGAKQDGKAGQTEMTLKEMHWSRCQRDALTLGSFPSVLLCFLLCFLRNKVLQLA
jgi:hypothetical protein